MHIHTLTLDDLTDKTDITINSMNQSLELTRGHNNDTKTDYNVSNMLQNTIRKLECNRGTWVLTFLYSNGGTID